MCLKGMAQDAPAGNAADSAGQTWSGTDGASDFRARDIRAFDFQMLDQSPLIAELAPEAEPDSRPEFLPGTSSQSSSNELAYPSAGSVAVAQPASTGKPEAPRIGPFSKVAVGIQATSLGVGGTIALPLTRSLNLRGNTNFFNMGYDFAVDGISYAFELHLRTGQVNVDWFPFHGGFHISPGVLIYKSDLAGRASVAAGNGFQLGGVSFTSGASDPIHGGASLVFSRTMMPSLMFGFGNMIPRSGRRWSFPIEFGVAYMGHNQVQLNLQGTACYQATCLSTASGSVQQDLNAEQGDLNESIKRLQAYPIISTGFAYRF